MLQLHDAVDKPQQRQLGRLLQLLQRAFSQHPPDSDAEVAEQHIVCGCCSTILVDENAHEEKHDPSGVG